MQVHYLEVVTPDVDVVCDVYAKLHGVQFAAADPLLGNARTAELSGGGRIGIRAPLADHETPIVRPYLLVDDIHAAVQTAEQSGAEVAHPPLEIPGHGSFAIVIVGGIQQGLWQN